MKIHQVLAKLGFWTQSFLFSFLLFFCRIEARVWTSLSKPVIRQTLNTWFSSKLIMPINWEWKIKWFWRLNHENPSSFGKSSFSGRDFYVVIKQFRAKLMIPINWEWIMKLFCRLNQVSNGKTKCQNHFWTNSNKDSINFLLSVTRQKVAEIRNHLLPLKLIFTGCAIWKCAKLKQLSF